jgi:hypothetical protein
MATLAEQVADQITSRFGSATTARPGEPGLVTWTDGPALTDVAAHLTAAGYTVTDARRDHPHPPRTDVRHVTASGGTWLLLQRRITARTAALATARSAAAGIPADALARHLVERTSLTGTVEPGCPAEHVAVAAVLDRLPFPAGFACAEADLGRIARTVAALGGPGLLDTTAHRAPR